MKCRILLRQLELPFERVTVDLFKGETRSDQHFARNPDGRIPVSSSTRARRSRVGRDPPPPRGGHALPALPSPRAHPVHQWMLFEQGRIEAELAYARFLKLSGRSERIPEVFANRLERGRDALGARPRGSPTAARSWPARPTRSPTSPCTPTSTARTKRRSDAREHSGGSLARPGGSPAALRERHRADPGTPPSGRCRSSRAFFPAKGGYLERIMSVTPHTREDRGRRQLRGRPLRVDLGRANRAHRPLVRCARAALPAPDARRGGRWPQSPPACVAGAQAVGRGGRRGVAGRFPMERRARGSVREPGGRIGRRGPAAGAGCGRESPSATRPGARGARPGRAPTRRPRKQDLERELQALRREADEELERIRAQVRSAEEEAAAIGAELDATRERLTRPPRRHTRPPPRAATSWRGNGTPPWQRSMRPVPGATLPWRSGTRPSRSVAQRWPRASAVRAREEAIRARDAALRDRHSVRVGPTPGSAGREGRRSEDAALAERDQAKAARDSALSERDAAHQAFEQAAHDARTMGEGPPRARSTCPSLGSSPRRPAPTRPSPLAARVPAARAAPCSRCCCWSSS